MPDVSRRATLQGRRNRESPPPFLSRPINPICTNKGGSYAHHIVLTPLDLQTFQRKCTPALASHFNSAIQFYRILLSSFDLCRSSRKVHKTLEIFQANYLPKSFLLSTFYFNSIEFIRSLQVK